MEKRSTMAVHRTQEPAEAKRLTLGHLHPWCALTTSAFPRVSTPPISPGPRTAHQLPYATAQLFSRILRVRLGVCCGTSRVTLKSHLCSWKCIGSRYFLHKLLSMWCFCPTAGHVGLSNQMRSKKIPGKNPSASVPPQHQPLRTANSTQTSTARAQTMALPLWQCTTNYHRKWEYSWGIKQPAMSRAGI